MIKLEVPEAFAIDYLSILAVKLYKDINNETKRKLFVDCVQQLGKDIAPHLNLISYSDEYRNLFDTNLAMYDAVEKARYGKEGEITPKQWDELNMARHRAKQELQKKFWGSELQETKT